MLVMSHSLQPMISHTTSCIIFSLVSGGSFFHSWLCVAYEWCMCLSGDVTTQGRCTPRV